MSTCLILDCFSLVYRSFFGLPTSIRRQDGQIINAVLGFYNTLNSLMRKFQPDYLFVASDDPSSTFRHELLPAYKELRPPMPEELRGQIVLIEEVIASFSIPLVSLAVYEADDSMGPRSHDAPADTLR